VPDDKAGRSGVAVVTGAGRPTGIGFAIARSLLEGGYRVVISDIDQTSLSHAADLLAEHGPIHAFPCDVTSEADVERLVADTATEHGSVDVMVCNAGIGTGLAEVVDLTLEAWQRALDVMATGTFLSARAAARTMVQSGTPGRIIIISSQAGKTGMPLLGAYCAAKFATVGLTQVMAHELGPHGITVNAVCPGTVDTEMLEVEGGLFDVYSQRFGMSKADYRRRVTRTIPLGRFAEPDDIADVVAFLASPAARYITGEAVNVTGGQEMH
jgi:NAD(P)-dependent dehydrogenase (short-subunit alcohol dehydrogenase family)